MRVVVTPLLGVLVSFCLGVSCSRPADATELPKKPAPPWPQRFVPVAAVPKDLAGIVVLDAREAGDYAAGHLPGAVRADWKEYRDGLLTTGALPKDLDELARELSALGVDEGKRVLVCGAGREGWGEEGRLAWMLAYLGHPSVAVLDGGCLAWARAGRPLSRDKPRPTPGLFRARPRQELRTTKDEVARALTDPRVQLIDARSVEEYRGATPYLEARGGHIPGAVHLEFKRVLDDKSALKDKDALQRLLREAGLDLERPVIAYCTGGVRSALLVMALREAGIAAKNYDGSFWEWAKDDALPVEK